MKLASTGRRVPRRPGATSPLGSTTEAVASPSSKSLLVVCRQKRVPPARAPAARKRTRVAAKRPTHRERNPRALTVILTESLTRESVARVPRLAQVQFQKILAKIAGEVPPHRMHVVGVA